MRLGVEKMAACSFASVLSDKTVAEENEAFAEIVEKSDFLLQWVVIDPRNATTMRQAEDLLKRQKSVGLKIHSVCHQYPFLDYADEVFAFASEHKALVMMHPDEPEKTAAIAAKYPNMNLILAHLGSMEHINAVLSSDCGNVYTDTSGGASNKNNVIELAVQTVGSEKVLFGTDTYSCAFQRGRIDYADISLSDKENILYKNALRLFPQLKELY